MNIDMYTNNSTPNTVNKRLTAKGTITGTLRDNTDMVNPVIRIEIPAANFNGINYMRITEFGYRYYYVMGVRVVGNKLLEVTLHCDVLMTYKSQFTNWTGIAVRQENQYNLYLNDSRYVCNENPVVGFQNFPNGLTTDSWVLAVAGGAS